MNTDHTVRHRVNRLHKKTGLGILLALAVLMASPSFGQQERTDDAAKTPTTKKVRRRLPAHFAALVSQKQRATIYQLQADYAEQMGKLRAQLDALIVNRDREIDGVLDPEQMAEVNKKRIAAEEKRAARTSEKATPKAETDS